MKRKVVSLLFLILLVLISCSSRYFFVEVYPYVTVEKMPSDSSQYFFVDTTVRRSPRCTTLAQASGRVMDMDKALADLVTRARRMGGHAFVIVEPETDVRSRKTCLFTIPWKGKKPGFKEMYFFKGIIVKYLPEQVDSIPADSSAADTTVSDSATRDSI
jgi:hypothetical protein